MLPEIRNQSFLQRIFCGNEMSENQSVRPVDNYTLRAPDFLYFLGKLYLKDGQVEFLEWRRLKDLVQKHFKSNPFPIDVRSAEPPDAKERDRIRKRQPETKEKTRMRMQTPEAKEKTRKCTQTPEEKE